MIVDIKSLGTFNRMAHEGAEEAAERLTQLTGIETFVEITKIDLVTVDELGQELDGDDHVGVRMDFDGAIGGQTVLGFTTESARNLVRVMRPDVENDKITGVNESAINELGNIMTGGFLDGWADHFETTIDFSTPTCVRGTSRELLTSDTDDLDGDTHIVVFKSRIVAVDETVDFRLYMLPDPASMKRLLGTEDEPNAKEIDLDKLALFKQMVAQGADTVSEDVTTMTGVETTVDITRLNFVPVENASSEVKERRQIGVVLEFMGPPSGYIMILWDEGSAHNMAEALLPGEDTDGFQSIHESAISELGNIMTSSFIDGWANVLQTTIDISTPQFLSDIGPAIVDPIIIQLGRSQDFVFFFDATVEADTREFDFRICALPNEEELMTALNRLQADRVHSSSVDL